MNISVNKISLLKRFLENTLLLLWSVLHGIRITIIKFYYILF